MPGKIELHYGANHTLLTEQFIRDHPQLLERPETFLYLTADPERAVRLKQNFFLQEEEAVAGDFPFQTPDRFLMLIFEKLNLPARPLSFRQRLLLLQQVVVEQQDRLHYFRYGDQIFPVSVLTGLLQFFDDLRLDDAAGNVREFTRRAEKKESGWEIRHDLALLYSAYEQALGNEYLDDAALLREVTAHLSPGFLQTHFPGVKNLVWEDASDLKTFHFRFIQGLKSAGLNIFLLLLYGENPEIFRPAAGLFQRLTELSDRQVAYREEPEISRLLFRPGEETIDLSDKISLTSHTNRLREVESLAGEIKKLVVDEKWRYGEVAVSSPLLPQYLPLLEAVFRRYCIPYSLKTPQPLGLSLPVQHLMLLIRLVTENYPLSLLKKILASPFFSYREMLRDSAYKQILSAVRVQSGREEILNYLKQVKRGKSEDAEDNRDVEEEYQRLIETLQQLYDDVAFWHAARSPGEIYDWFVQLFERQRIIPLLIRAGKDEGGWQTEEYLNALQQFMEAVYSWKIVMARRFPERRFPAEEFRQFLSLINRVFSYRQRRPHRFGVQIVPFRQVPQLSQQALFLIGMEDGAFPGREASSFTEPQALPESWQAYVPRHLLWRDREMMLRILQLPAKRVHFSYPLYHKDNLVLPSIFLRELERISGAPLRKDTGVKLYSAADILQKMVPLVTDSSASGNWQERIPTPLRELSPAGVTDRVNYLLQVERARENTSGFSRWEGALREDKMVAGFLQAHFRAARFSVSGLEDYARCPLLYFFRRLLRVEPAEEAEEFLQPLDRGGVVHRILFRFYRENPPEQHTLERLLAIGEEELEKIPVPRGILWQMEKEFFLGDPEHPGLLPAFWEYEQEMLRQSDFLPRHFEFSFGMTPGKTEEHDPASVPEPFVWREEEEEFFFKGKIDRVEISPGGNLLVVDYKTGQIASLSDIWEGKSLQLPVYLQAAAELLKEEDSRIFPVGGTYYLLKDESNIEKKIVFCDQAAAEGLKISRNGKFPNSDFTVEEQPATLRDLIRRSFSFAVGYIRAIREGNFPHTQDSNACRYGNNIDCRFLPLCRLNRAKQAHLQRENLG